MLVGLTFGALFLWIESRVADPIVPLALFRVRSVTISVAAMFLAAFGFFGAFWVGIAGAVGAVACVAFLREVPMRSTFSLQPDHFGEEEAAF